MAAQQVDQDDTEAVDDLHLPDDQPPQPGDSVHSSVFQSLDGAIEKYTTITREYGPEFAPESTEEILELVEKHKDATQSDYARTRVDFALTNVLEEFVEGLKKRLEGKEQVQRVENLLTRSTKGIRNLDNLKLLMASLKEKLQQTKAKLDDHKAKLDRAKALSNSPSGEQTTAPESS